MIDCVQSQVINIVADDCKSDRTSDKLLILNSLRSLAMNVVHRSSHASKDLLPDISPIANGIRNSVCKSFANFSHDDAAVAFSYNIMRSPALWDSVNACLADVAKQTEFDDQDEIARRSIMVSFMCGKTTISVHDYMVNRLYAFYDINLTKFAWSLALIDRSLNQDNRMFLKFSPSTALKMLAAASVVTRKFICDPIYDMKYSARVFGITEQQMKLLEILFLNALSFNVYVPPDILSMYEDYILVGMLDPQWAQHCEYTLYDEPKPSIDKCTVTLVKKKMTAS